MAVDSCIQPLRNSVIRNYHSRYQVWLVLKKKVSVFPPLWDDHGSNILDKLDMTGPGVVPLLAGCSRAEASLLLRCLQ